MATVIILALVISLILYLSIGFSSSKLTQGLADLIPIVSGKTASVRNSKEFSASTVATSISLATVVLAYFELVGSFGLWLLWTAITTSLGIAVVSLASKRIWTKLNEYDHRPSLHEFLGTEFKSPKVAMVGAICTSLGFLLIFATELIVGSRFLAKLIPEIPEWVTIAVLSTTGFVYTFLGGFRAVIKTDQIQMTFMWIFIGVLGAYYVYHLALYPSDFANIPASVIDLSWRPGLTSFLMGVAVMNLTLFISNMSIWQRIAGAQEARTIEKGLQGSILGSALSWGLLVVLACLAFTVAPAEDSQNVFTNLIIHLGESALGQLTLFFIITGLYGAMLSTASTNLIVVAHTIYEDIFAKFRSLGIQERIESKQELRFSRLILLGAALFAVGLVIVLKTIGFSIADLAFAIYGGGLALCPAIIIAIYQSPNQLVSISKFATTGIILGFISGWSAAIYGKIVGDGNLIFLSPCISFCVALTSLIIGLVMKKK